MAVNLLLEVNQGASLRISFGFYDAAGDALDFTGAYPRIQFRRTTRSLEVLLEGNPANGRLDWTNEATGKLELILSPDDTLTIDSNCVFGIEVTHANGEINNYPGFLRVNPLSVQ